MLCNSLLCPARPDGDDNDADVDGADDGDDDSDDQGDDDDGWCL